MKRTFIISALLVLVHCVNAQCVANAGGNKEICMSMNTTTAGIGGTPTASGGTAPYTYCWSTNPIPSAPNSNTIFTASDFLNDTTIANPIITLNNLVGASTTFYLKVKDALGCVSYDSCKISPIFSQFIILPGNATVFIDQNAINNNDSTTIPFASVSGANYPPYTYSWTPANGLSTTTHHSGFHALPSVSTCYSVSVINSKGCQSPSYLAFCVVVCPAGFSAGPFSCDITGIKGNFLNKINLAVYPNPVSNNLSIELLQSKIYTIKLTSMLGTVCKEIYLADAKTEINLSRLNTGIYFLQVFEKGNLVAVKKIIKE